MTPRALPDGCLCKRTWVRAATATSCGAQPLLGNFVLPSCGGVTCPTSVGMQTARRSWCGEVALSFREAGRGLQGSCSCSPSGWVVLGWAPASLPQQSCLRAVGPWSSFTLGNGVGVPGSPLCTSPCATWVFNLWQQRKAGYRTLNLVSSASCVTARGM